MTAFEELKIENAKLRRQRDEAVKVCKDMLMSADASWDIAGGHDWAEASNEARAVIIRDMLVRTREQRDEAVRVCGQVLARLKELGSDRGDMGHWLRSIVEGEQK